MISHSTHVWLAQLDEHHNQFYFLLRPFKTARCQFCTEMSDLCYLRKPRIDLHNVSYVKIYVLAILGLREFYGLGDLRFLQTDI